MNKYLVTDCETGGVTLEESLLTAYFGVLNERFVLQDEIHLLVKPDDGIYRVTPKALEVNKINLIEHDRIALPYKAAKPILYQFLQEHYQREKLIPVGHGVHFDIQRYKKDLISQGSWENFVSYRCLDTSVAAQFLRAAGLFPDDVSGSLESLVDYFKLPKDGNLHDAQVDSLQTVSVLRELLKIVKPISKENNPTQ